MRRNETFGKNVIGKNVPGTNIITESNYLS